MDEQKTNFINLSDDSKNVGNIFNELSGELGDLDFGSDQEKKAEAKKKDWFMLAYRGSANAFTLAIIIGIFCTLDVFIRTSDDTSFLSNLPVCSYLSWGTENYDNTDCKTLPAIISVVWEEQKKIEEDIVSNLAIVVPKELQSTDILNNPKVRYIQEHTGDSRISVTAIMDRFIEIKNRTAYQGEDIDCKGITVDEGGELSISCDVYGGALFSPTKSATHSSREVAIEFLGRLSDPKQGFQILGFPKTLEIASYSSSDVGIKSLFSTKTSLSLKLRYLSPKKI